MCLRMCVHAEGGEMLPSMLTSQERLLALAEGGEPCSICSDSSFMTEFGNCLLSLLSSRTKDILALMTRFWC